MEVRLQMEHWGSGSGATRYGATGGSATQRTTWAFG